MTQHPYKSIQEMAAETYAKRAAVPLEQAAPSDDEVPRLSGVIEAIKQAHDESLEGEHQSARAVLRDASATPVGHYRLDAPCPALTDSARPLRTLLGQGRPVRLTVLGHTHAPIMLGVDGNGVLL